MKKVLYILGELEESDVDWLVGFGEKRRVRGGTVLIREGEPIDALYVVLEGGFEVTVGRGGEAVADIGTGEVLGEISFVDARPPTATVTATEESVVLAVPRRALADKLDRDRAFAARFYRALATFLAVRLRDTVGRLGYGPEENLDGEVAGGADELDLELMEAASRGGARFERMLRRMRGG